MTTPSPELARRANWLRNTYLPLQSLLIPLLGVLILGLAWGRPLGVMLGLVLTATLFASFLFLTVVP